MMRSLWTAASGMKTQQTMVDSIANNLSNVNTIGFKKERLEFKSLLYETMGRAGDIEKGGSPVNLQVGHGVKTVASVKTFTQGAFTMTEGAMDFAIEGDGFFVVETADGDENYTRDGSFKLATYEGGLMVTTSSGRAILDTDGNPIVFSEDVVGGKLTVNENGEFFTVVDDENIDLDVRMNVVQFKNTQGLLNEGNGLYSASVASGEAMSESDTANLEKSLVVQGALEASNVQVVEEMVKLIVAQRAYELSSKAIQTSDEMLAMANELKR